MRGLTITTIVFTLLLSACTGGNTETFNDISAELGGSGGADGDFAATDAPDDALAPLAYEGEVLANRKIIQEAFLELTDDDTEGLYKRITSLVERAGGFVASAELTRSGDEDRGPFVDMTVRIPADDMTSTLGAIEDLADEVTAKRIGSQDVTEEYADIEAQLRNLTALEEELLVILTEVREKSSSDANELLNVFERIRQVRDEIERLQGRQRLFDDLIDLATIDISLYPESGEAPIVDDGWKPGDVVRDALRATVDAFQAIADGFIWLTLGILPVLLVVAIPVLAIAWFWRRRRQAAGGAAVKVAVSTGAEDESLPNSE
ncbi:MAG: DUF4349 domain-containing protein [Acidimicrobiia bacterium]|nr:DUF4349 domain-containing protein [Acidimicrobiia bacterium]